MLLTSRLQHQSQYLPSQTQLPKHDTFDGGARNTFAKRISIENCHLIFMSDGSFFRGVFFLYLNLNEMILCM